MHAFIQELERLPSVCTLRIHTRIPVVLPERIDEGLLSLLSNLNLNKVIVLHSNHPNELDDSVQKVCVLLRQANCHLLNQSVILKGINDDAGILTDLSKRLFSFGVLPYYLHLLDKVTGAAHFDIPQQEVINIYQRLQRKLPGYLLPRLIREEVGKGHKTILA